MESTSKHATIVRRTEVVFNTWAHIVPEGWDWREALNREYWLRIVDKLRPGDSVQVQSFDRRVRFWVYIFDINISSNPIFLDFAVSAPGCRFTTTTNREMAHWNTGLNSIAASRLHASKWSAEWRPASPARPFRRPVPSAPSAGASGRSSAPRRREQQHERPTQRHRQPFGTLTRITAKLPARGWGLLASTASTCAGLAPPKSAPRSISSGA
jgi:hypothetical protein